jgi:nicotinamidase/pyrazinamidase
MAFATPRQTALVVVDVQNDFLPGGSLTVPDGDAVIPRVNSLLDRAAELFGGGVYATQDWHPVGHSSFETLWPVHCVKESAGAEFSSEVQDAFSRAGAIVVRKGTEVAHDSYSGFRDNDGVAETELRGLLVAREVRRVFVCGLATDFCVKFTALDAVNAGFDTFVIKDACVCLVISWATIGAVQLFCALVSRLMNSVLTMLYISITPVSSSRSVV